MTINDQITADMDAAEGTALQRLLRSIIGKAFDKATKNNNLDVSDMYNVLDQDIKYWFDITSDMSGSDVECFLDAMRRGKTVCAAYHLIRILFSIGPDNADEISNKVRERFCTNIALLARTNDVAELGSNATINAARLYHFREELFVDKRYSEAFNKLASVGNWMGIVELMTEVRMKHVVDQYLVHKGDILTVDWEMMPLDGSVTLTIKHGDGIIYGLSYPGRTTEAQEMMKLLPTGTYYAMRTFGTSLISRLNITKMQNELLAKKDETSHLAKEVKPEHEAPKPVDPRSMEICDPKYYKLTLDECIGVPIIPAFEDLEGMARVDVHENDKDWSVNVNAFIDTVRTNFPITFGKALLLGEQGMVLGYDPKVEGPKGQVEESVTQKANLRQVINTLQACVYTSPIYNKQDEEFGMIPCTLQDRIDTVFAKFDAIKEVIVNNYQKLVNVDQDGKLAEVYIVPGEHVVVEEVMPAEEAEHIPYYEELKHQLHNIAELSTITMGGTYGCRYSGKVWPEEFIRNVTALIGYELTKNINTDNYSKFDKIKDVVVSRFDDAMTDKVVLATIGSILQVCKMLACEVRSVAPDTPNHKDSYVIEFDRDKFNGFVKKLYGVDISGYPEHVKDFRYHVMAYLNGTRDAK